MAHFHKNTVLFPTEVESIYFETKKSLIGSRPLNHVIIVSECVIILTISPLIVTDFEMCFSKESVYL